MKKPFRRAFIEITNGCNLACGFCAASARPRREMTPAEFESAAAQAGALASVISLHLLGEPLTHSRFPEILGCCSKLGLRVNLVTNGVLLDRFAPLLYAAGCLEQISVSLHSLACLPKGRREAVLQAVAAFAKAKPPGLTVGLRLRASADDSFRSATLGDLLAAFGKEPAAGASHVKLAEGVFLNFGAIFNWPGGAGGTPREACLGLKHHFGILSDGRVVPCCADFDGALAFGSVHDAPLAEILSSQAALDLRARISGKKPMPGFCASCGFAAPEA